MERFDDDDDGKKTPRIKERANERVCVCEYKSVRTNEWEKKQKLRIKLACSWRSYRKVSKHSYKILFFLPKMSDGNADNLSTEWMTRRESEREKQKSEHIFTQKTQQLCEDKKHPHWMNEWTNERNICEQQVNDSDIGPRYENRCVFSSSCRLLNCAPNLPAPI